MTWPSSDVVTTAMDAGSDTPPRAEIKSWADKFNQLRNHVTTFMQGVLAAADAAAARTAIGALSKTMNTNRLLGRTTASAGDVEEITPSGGLALSAGNLTVVDASATVAGKVELATDAETQTGTDTARAVTPAGMKAAQLQLRAAQNATGLSAVNFTDIPAWARRITILVRGVSSSAGNFMAVQLGDSGGYETSGYTAVAARFAGGASATVTESGGFLVSAFILSTHVHGGTLVIERVGTSGNEWVCTGTMSSQSGAIAGFSSGGKELSAALDRLRIITTGGDTFAGGVFALSYE